MSQSDKAIIQNDDVRHAPESGEPDEGSSRARAQEPLATKKPAVAKPGEAQIGEDRESGQTDGPS